MRLQHPGFLAYRNLDSASEAQVSQKLQILQESKDNLTKQKERGGRGGNPFKGTISENLHSVRLTYEEEASPLLMIAYSAQTAT